MADKRHTDGLVWRGNVSLHHAFHLRDGEVLGDPIQPRGSTLSKKEFAEQVRERKLHGLYVPAPK